MCTSGAGRSQSMRVSGLLDLPGIGDAFLGLRREGQPVTRERGERPRHQVGTELGQAIRELARRRVGSDGDPLGQGDRAGVEAGLHAHDHDPGLRVAGHDRPLDRGGAAPARQQRGVQVEAAVPGYGEEGARQDLTIGNDHDDVGRSAAKLGRFTLGS